MIRHCDGNDPNLRGEDNKPCDCGKTFDDVDTSTVYPHFKFGGVVEREIIEIMHDAIIVRNGPLTDEQKARLAELGVGKGTSGEGSDAADLEPETKTLTDVRVREISVNTDHDEDSTVHRIDGIDDLHRLFWNRAPKFYPGSNADGPGIQT